MRRQERRQPWRLSRARNWPDSVAYIQITNDRDCLSPDTLMPHYKEEHGYWWDAREAMKAAFTLRSLWKECKYVTFSENDTDETDDNLIAMAQSIYDKATKCEVCGALIEYELYMVEDSLICGEYCAEKLAEMDGAQVS